MDETRRKQASVSGHSLTENELVTHISTLIPACKVQIKYATKNIQSG
jgi:hypothetical protein